MACFILKIQQFELPSFHSAWHQKRNAFSLKSGFSSWFSAVYPFQVLEDMFMCTCASSQGKERAFIKKANSRCFCWFPAAIFVDQNGAPIWHLHTKLFKCVWGVWANNSETVCQKDRRQIVYILVFHNISFSWLLPLDGFQYFFVSWQWKWSILNSPIQKPTVLIWEG